MRGGKNRHGWGLVKKDAERAPGALIPPRVIVDKAWDPSERDPKGVVRCGKGGWRCGTADLVLRGHVRALPHVSREHFGAQLAVVPAPQVGPLEEEVQQVHARVPPARELLAEDVEAVEVLVGVRLQPQGLDAEVLRVVEKPLAQELPLGACVGTGGVCTGSVWRKTMSGRTPDH